MLDSVTQAVRRIGGSPLLCSPVDWPTFTVILRKTGFLAKTDLSLHLQDE
jgi:hypothetical protein